MVDIASRADSFAWDNRPAALAYGVALLAVALAWASSTLGSTPAPVAPFIFAVIAATWYGGTRAGMLAIGLSVLCVMFLTAPGEVQRLVFFLAISVFIVSITASERRTLRSLRRSEAGIREVIDTIPAMVWAMSAQGKLEFINKPWLDYSGVSFEEALGDPPQTIHPDDAPRALDTWRRALSSGSSYEVEMRLRRADGEYRSFLVRTVPLLDGQRRILRWYGTSTDIEDAKRAEQALRDSAERLQCLSRRLLEIQEEERRHLARELHDEFGQILAAVNMHLHIAKDTAGAQARASLDECTLLLQQATDRMRSLVLDLRPTILDTAGLDATLRSLAKQHETHTGMAVHVVGTIDNVTPEAAIACFRVAQEALTNVTRHARARQVWIEVVKDEGTVALAIRDDGTGFDVDYTIKHAPGQGHVGLLGMKERVEILGGKLRITSEPGRGSTIHVSFPC